MDDLELLHDYAGHRSEEAFRTVVERHIGLVHGAALRLVANPHAAEEVTQAVFILLSQKASSLRPGTVVAGWLYRTTRFVASQYLRTERRRMVRQEAYNRMNTNSQADTGWEQLAPVLEEAMGNLSAADRDAVLLRYFEGCDFAEVSRQLGTTEPAAKMRVSRAVEKLRKLIGKRGLAWSGTALLSVLATNAVHAAPPSLGAATAAAVLTSQEVAGLSAWTLAKGAMKAMMLIKLKLAGAVALAAVIAIATAAAAVRTAQSSQSTASKGTNVPPTIDTILDRYVRATGGTTAWLQATSRVVHGSMDWPVGRRMMPLEFFVKAPDRWLVVIHMPQGVMREGYDGKTHWFSGPGPGSAELDATAATAMMPRVMFYRVIKLKELFPMMAIEGSVVVDGRPAWIVQAQAGAGSREKLYFDQETGLLIRNDWTFHRPNGPIEREYHYSDYRDVSGVKIPFIERQPDSTEAGWVFRANDMQLNVPLKDELFEKTEEP